MSALEAVWKQAEDAVVAGDLAALEHLLGSNEPLFRSTAPRSSWLGGLAPNYRTGDARSILAREHHFEAYPQLSAHLAERAVKGSAVARFEAAVDAVVSGDLAGLERGLAEEPGLVRTRSARRHRAMLLHYVGANGVESWRQRTPRNAVDVLEMLVRAGAEVDAMAGMYEGSTTLGLVATSIHPLRAGVQNDLIAALLRHGAHIDHPEGAGNYQGIVNGCLANGRSGAAAFLAWRGARLDLEGAAGVGRLEVVRGFFGSEGRLQPGTTPAQLQSGFQWACEYGHTAVVEFLLGRQLNVGEIHRGQTGLHWAAYGGHADIVRRLLEAKAPADIADARWGNTPLGWALHGWAYPPEFPGSDYHEVVRRLVDAGASVSPMHEFAEKLRADPQMLAALHRPGADAESMLS